MQTKNQQSNRQETPNKSDIDKPTKQNKSISFHFSSLFSLIFLYICVVHFFCFRFIMFYSFRTRWALKKLEKKAKQKQHESKIEQKRNQE